MGRIKSDNWWLADYQNISSYKLYYDKIVEIATSMFEWHNLPDTIDERYLELTLFRNGYAVFFKDDDLGYLALKCSVGAEWNVYNVPITRQPIVSNGTHFEPLNIDNSVLIYNNLIHTPSHFIVYNYAKRLYELDRAIDINCNAQKTPILLVCDKESQLTLKNVYEQYSGNAPAITVDKSFNTDNIKVLTTTAPYVADNLHQLKQKLWYEILTYLGVGNLDDKRERYTNLEISEKNNDSAACRYSMLTARKQACQQINKMFEKFGLNIDCTLRDDYISNVYTNYIASPQEVKDV